MTLNYDKKKASHIARTQSIQKLLLKAQGEKIMTETSEDDSLTDESNGFSSTSGKTM